jgi:hypothetical protein
MDEFNLMTFKSGPFVHYQLKNMLILKSRVYVDKYEYSSHPLEKSVTLYDTRDIKEFEGGVVIP